jgi:hypothetical protein
MISIPQNNVAEFTFISAKKYDDPFNEIEVDAVFTGPDGVEQRVPAFWAGGDTWRVRFASPAVGQYRFTTVCTDAANAGLHGREGAVTVEPYTGDNLLYQHGPIRISADKRHFQHADGTPFFWLGDTWWMGLTKRLRWPGDFQSLAADRVEKGFNLIQIVAGLYPDMPAFDERGANEAGYPWEPEFARIDPAYFDLADRRIRYLVEMGLAPCIVGCWAYFFGFMGEEKLKQHWRNLVARYGAYPVVWCLAGEGAMPYYLSENKEEDSKAQIKGWTNIGRYLRSINAFGNPITIHPTQYGREQVEDPAVLDYEMLQTGHGSLMSFPNTVKSVRHAREQQPTMPVFVSEVDYEGIGQASRDDVQRLIFWASMLNGAAGHTYGANGIWQVNRGDRPYGPSPHGMSWGDTPWDVAAQLPGSRELGIAKSLFERYPWWQFEAHPEWIEGTNNRTGFFAPENDAYFVPYAAGIPGKVRVIYYHLFMLAPLGAVQAFEPSVTYRAFFFNPSTGDEIDLGAVNPDAEGKWRLQGWPPIYRDWVIVMEAK